jgi:ankyrin repeat protein
MDIYKLDSLQKKLLKNIQKQYGIRLPSKNKYKSLSKSKKRRSPLQIEIKSGGGIMEDEDDLITASENGDLEGLKLLVEERGANVRAQHNQALISASYNGHLDVVKYLVENGAKISAQRNKALIEASDGGHLDIVKYLVERGADVSAQRNQALIHASRKGRLDIVKYLAENGADVSARDNQALVHASRNGYLDIVKYLVERGADVSAQRNRALIAASYGGRLDIVKYLVERGAYVHAQDTEGDTALIGASEHGRLDIVKYLVERGADVRAENTEGDTALIRASEHGHLDIVKYLVERGADVRAENTEGDTALIRASANGHSEVIEFLTKFLKGNLLKEFRKSGKKILSLVKDDKQNKDIWYKWQSLCSQLDEKNKDELKNLAFIQGISTNGQSKGEICNLLKTEYTKQMLQTPECHNDSTILGDPIEYIPKPLLFTFNEDGKRYCFNIIELLEYINKGKKNNPYTNQPLPIDAIKERMITLRQILLESKLSLVNILDEIKNNPIMTKQSILRLKIVNLIALLNYTPNIEAITNMSNERVETMFEMINGNPLMRTYGEKTLDNLINESLRILQIDDINKDTRKAAYEIYLNEVFKDE